MPRAAATGLYAALEPHECGAQHLARRFRVMGMFSSRMTSRTLAQRFTSSSPLLHHRFDLC